MSGWFDHALRRMSHLKRRVSRRGVAATAVVVLVTAAGGLLLGVGNAAVIPEAVPVDSGMVKAFTNAAQSCSALTPPRLAAQVMAVTGFKATPQGGIAGLTAAEWKAWAPWSGADPADPAASLLALAHLTCDLVGQVRLAAAVGDPWRLAVAASRTSVAAVKSAGGVPAAAAVFMEQVDSYVAYYTIEASLVTGWRPPGVPAPGTSTTPSSMPTAQSSPPATPTPAQPSDPTPTPAPTYPAPAPPTTQAPPPAQFTFASFGSASGLRLNGSAAVAGGHLVLASGLDKAGSAWSTTRIDPARSFTTSFAFNVSKITDGIAFVIQGQAGTALGVRGGGLGYGARPSDAPGQRITPSVDIEFDTWDNSPDGFDPAGHQHIAVMTNGDITQHHAWADPGFSMHSEGTVYVWITYDAAAHRLSVFAGRSATRPASPLLTYTVDLRAAVGTAQAYVGFTGGTGLTNITDPVESVLNWSLRSS